MRLNLAAAFGFPFKEKKWWIKILIGIVPIANLGYVLRVLKDAKEGKEATLPEWDAWDELFKSGLMAIAIGFCYVLPILLVQFLGVVPGIGMLFKLAGALLSLIYIPAVTVALCKYLEDGQFKSAFDFKAIYERVLVNIKEYLIVSLIYLVIVGVLSVIAAASIVTCLFPIMFPVVFYIFFYTEIAICRACGELYSLQPDKGNESQG